MIRVLQTGCLLAGILCLFYFVVICCYVRHTEWFQFIWLAGGLLFLGIGAVLRYLMIHPDSMLRYLAVLFFILGAAGSVCVLVFGSRVVKDMRSRPYEKLDYVIVLGAQVRGTQPSRALRKRLDCALDYAQKDSEVIFILSGGQGADEQISEAQCMYNYMEIQGIDPDRLRMEDRSTSTKENLRFSAELLDKEKDRIGILSNNFHIHRALLLAEEEGYQYVAGIPAPSDPVMQPHYVIREICALIVREMQVIVRNYK